ncbi:LysR family transcriptional regulator [Pelagibacterium sp. H642]|uniref:LysR family transcriptional regulator n=1 Tax=Pelagibacterium sp. H642 TaxID=1881069 RepID=UPI0028168B2B|nr:LysR family transcriptional regulator [Pelagibacterium sp. H642]WMT92734.1 LysR family transcriptional regulator [Pelagibacterium sp. H642]
MRINHHQIVAFNAACRYKGFSNAAKALGVTQSSVTQNVAKFETEIGARLFERRRSGLVLTPAGSKIYAVTEEIGHLYLLLEERMGEYAHLNKGLLRVVAAASQPALSYLRRFKDRHPGIELAFDNASWRRCADLLRDREADVALMPEPENAAGLYIWPIEERVHMALAHESHPFYGASQISITEMAETTIVLASSRSFARWRFERRAAELGVKLQDVVTVGSTPMAVEAVRNGLGIGITYGEAMRIEPHLRSIPITDLADPYSLVAACNSDVRDLAIIRSFFDCMD